MKKKEHINIEENYQKLDVNRFENEITGFNQKNKNKFLMSHYFLINSLKNNKSVE